MSGVKAAVNPDDGKNQGRVEQTKVKRYWPGRAPDWAKEKEEEEGDEAVVLETEHEQSKTKIAAPVVVKKADDPRLQRLAASRAVRAPEVVRRRHRGSDEDEDEEDEEEDADVRRQRHHQEGGAEAEGGLDAPSEPAGRPELPGMGRPDSAGEGAGKDRDEEEEDEEAIAMRRQMLKARLREQQQEEAEAAEVAPIGEDDEESAEESEYETDSDEEEDERQMLKPVFVSKAERETIKERERLEAAEAEAAAERAKVRAEERKAETRDIVIETIRKEVEAENAAPAKDEADVATDDDDDEEAEFEAWKQRELRRIKRERDAKEAAEKEAAERERLRNMTEEERAAWELANPKVEPHKEKKKWRFMQKYWHKGAYFQESSDGKDRTGVDEIFRRDFSAPTGEDKMDKSILPQVMQVKNFGRSGRSKWTHLVNEDTTDWSAPRAEMIPRGKIGRASDLPEFSKPKKLRT
uniref:Microfibrillar-associated protein 1 n=1 Tax=Tetraselmis sp. GSL018 TaxID=582737 RepID=A0A061QYR8_9CHLO